MKICPKCGTPMEYREIDKNTIEYVCPVCGYKETIKVKKKLQVEGIKIQAEKRGEGVIEEKRKKVQISEEELESALEILANSDFSG